MKQYTKIVLERECLCPCGFTATIDCVKASIGQIIYEGVCPECETGLFVGFKLNATIAHSIGRLNGYIAKTHKEVNALRSELGLAETDHGQRSKK